jgi:hypothetical protein
MLRFDVANMWCWVLCRGEGRRGSWCWMLHVTRVATWSQYSHNMVVTWGRREERLLMLDVARNRVRNMLTTHLQHAHNIYSVHFKSNGWWLNILGSDGCGPVRWLVPGSDVWALAVQNFFWYLFIQKHSYSCYILSQLPMTCHCNLLLCPMSCSAPAYFVLWLFKGQGTSKVAIYIHS